MKLPEICIRQPVLAIVLSLVLVVLGLMAYQRLEIRFFPELQLPIVSINTTYEGASPDLMESQVTTPIENAIAGVDGIRYITSSSSTSSSTVWVEFNLGGNFESEAAAIRDKVFGVQDQLPPDANPPTVTVGTQGTPLIGIGFTDNVKSPADIRDYIERSVYPLLRQLPGVGAVSIIGASDYAMRIWLNSQKMGSYGITVGDVKTALTDNNIYFPAGSIQDPTRTYTVISNTRLQNADEFSQIIVKQSPTGTIRIRDFADVDLGYRSLYDYPMRINGKNGILLIVDPLQTANPIDVARNIQKNMAQIQSNLPPGMHAEITFDLSKFLKSSIHETFWSIAEAVILVMLIVYLFLGSLRPASIAIVTIPVSLISVFAIIKLFGFSINTMSLLGIVLAIGLVVDDAIVMLENIHRHIEHGLSPIHAAIKGSKEISVPVIAMTITLIAVYAPVGFIEGFTSELFKEFAFTLAGAVLISGFVALTLSPMMCSRILQSTNKETRFTHWLEHFFTILSQRYQRLLRTALNHRHYIILALLIIAIAGIILFRMTPSEFIPQEDYGVFNVEISAPTGSSLAYTDQYTQLVESILHKIPDINNFTTQVNTTSSEIRVVLKPWSHRHNSTQKIISQLNLQLAKIPGVNAAAIVPDVIDYGERGSDVTINLVTAGDYQDLLDPINKLMNILKAYPGLVNLQTDLKFDSQQYSITINRDLAAITGVSIQDIADAVTAMMSSAHWTDVQSGNKSYAVIVQMRKEDLANFNALRELYVKGSVPANSPVGTPNSTVPLSSLIQLSPRVAQAVLHHFNRLRSGTISASLAPGTTESQALNYVNQQVKNVLKANIQFSYSGKASQFIEASGSMTGIFLLAFVFIYLVLSAQFGSFIDPLIILFAVPLSIVGALFTLWLGGGTMNLYSQIGLVTLVGLVSKHGILITQFTNDLRRQGVPMIEAIIAGATVRLRPILMTTAAMVFGAIPLAFAMGPGSVGRHQIGWVIVGGLVFGTFFSLIVVPIAYYYIGRLKNYGDVHKA